MPHRVPGSKGSFASPFDELVVQFTDGGPARVDERAGSRASKLQERLDVHALLFARAWRLEDDGD